MRKLIIIGGIVLFMGCNLFHHSTVQKELPSPKDAIATIPEKIVIDSTCEQKLQSYIDRYWSYDDSISHYYYISNKIGLSVVPELFPCFVGMDTADCFKLLGRPHKKEPYGYVYYYYGDCFDFETIDFGTCDFFLVQVSGSKVKGAREDGVSKTTD